MLAGLLAMRDRLVQSRRQRMVQAPVFDASSAVAYSVGITGFAREVMREKYDLALSAVLRAAKSISAEEYKKILEKQRSAPSLEDGDWTTPKKN